MTLPYLSLVVLSASAIFFYRAGRLERSWGLFWAGLSIGISFVVLRFLAGGLLGVLAAQAALFVGITAYRMRFRR
jgi:hypothetical protein